jgi:predicted lipoprotein with Yx(FWY)xxD motif
LIVPVLVAAAVAASGCGGSSKDDGGNTKAPAGETVATMNVVGYGKVLAVSGKPLYLHSSDPPGGSKCDAGCTSTWPPFTTKGDPGAGEGVDSSLLSTFKRPDGTTQVLYDKHALYKHAGRGLGLEDAGVKSKGEAWYLVSPSGKPVKATKSGGY